MSTTQPLRSSADMSVSLEVRKEISYLQEVRADAVKQRIRLGELQDKLRQFTHDNHLRRDYERERAWAVSKAAYSPPR